MFMISIKYPNQRVSSSLLVKTGRRRVIIRNELKADQLLYWFRTDLRLHDSPALIKALDLGPVEFYPVWCWDPYYVYNTPVGPNRWQFLLSKLLVIRGEPSITLPYIWSRWGITHLAFEEDDDNQHSRPRDESIIKAAKQAGLEVIPTPGHTLYNQEEVMTAAKGNLPASYRGFLTAIEKLGPPSPALDPPATLPDPGPTTLDDPLPPEFLERWKKAWTDRQTEEKDVNKKNRTAEDQAYRSPYPLSGPAGKFEIPTIEELGIQTPTSHHRGGETVALQKLEEYLKDKEKVLKFEKPKTFTRSFDPPSTTTLSAHLKFGTLSARLFYERIKKLEADNPKIKISTPPESLIGQLLWRDFFHLQQSKIPNFHQIDGNRICRSLDWKLKDRNRDKNLDSEAESHLDAWSNGMTGFPWIDAIMRQLQTEGWMEAPISVQKKANCVIGERYPKPLVNEKEARESCLKQMKEGYQLNKYGIDSSSKPSTPHKSKTASPDKKGVNAATTSKRKLEKILLAKLVLVALNNLNWILNPRLPQIEFSL
ncbi:hypothetical protein KEM48_010420 [Puccinia striiformis f. sp. tritici PST-130]|nr:hypothetical protein KEM48_010420 [Puccinia striiformis f. sp. tritici PST-130]